MKNHTMDNININSVQLQHVTSFKHPGSILHGNNSIEEEIKGRIVLGNKSHYANQALFKSKLLSKNSKLRIYRTSVWPVITYACVNMGPRRIHKTKTIGIRKEDIKKNLWTH
jgi:hypothetical protein